MIALPLARSLATPLATSLVASGTVSRPTINTIAFIGDSITDYNFLGQTASFKSFRDRSWYSWALGSLGWPITPKYNPSSLSDGWGIAGVYEYATPGYTCAAIQSTHGPEVVANPADLVFILAGANDLGNSNATAASAAASVKSLVDYFRITNGMRVAVGALTPRASANNSAGSDGSLFSVRVAAVNAELRAWCTENQIPFCDWENDLTDSGFWKTNYATDNVHPDALGAQVMGAKFATFLQTNYTLPTTILNADLFTALGATSDCTSGWSGFTSGAGSSATLSTVAGDALGSWRRVAFTSVNRTSHYTQLSRSSIPLPAGTGAGDFVQPVVNLRIAAGSDIASIECTAAATNYNSWPLRSSSQWAGSLNEWEGLFVGPPLVVGAGITFALTVKFYGTGTVDIRRFGVRKVTSPALWA